MLRALVLGIMGLLVAAIGVVAFVGLQPPGQMQAAVVPQRSVSVIVAAHQLRPGSLLAPGDLAARDMPASTLPAGARIDATDARNALVGAMVRRTLGEKDPIVGDDVLRPGDRGFLAAVLAPGTRAVSVAVDSVSGEAGLIWPGDRVDLILTQEINGNDQALGHRVAGEVVLGDVRVIAVDQQLVQGGQASGLLEGRPPNARTITLEVTPRDAARIAVATRLGKLQVVLRSAEPGGPAIAPEETPIATASADGPPIPDRAAAPDTAATASPTIWGGDVSQALGGGKGNADRKVEIHLYQGTRQVETYKF
jgi:pilus assembly protein CpaB